MRRSALIVDDSRVAMVTLKRMLEPHQVTIESAESGEEAIEYLRSNVPPTVVFLDHMMPGMDGFDVLGLVKKDPRLAAIPIVMYTSKEGEAYMGQALARGAFAVLRKPPNPSGLLRILEQVGLIADPALAARRGNEPATPSAPTAVPAAAPRIERAIPPTVPVMRPVGSRPVPARPVMRPVAPAPGPAPVAEASAEPVADSAGGSLIWVAVYTLVLLAPSVWFFQEYRAAEQAAATLADENRALQARVPGALSASATEATATTPSARWVEALTWAVNLHNQYGYDQLPLDDQRLGVVRELVTRLTQAGFKGAVRVETHVGEFCLMRDGFGEFKLPEPATPIADCEIVDYTAEQATTLGRRQSPAFSRYVVTQSSARSPVQIELVTHGNERPLVRYPNVATLRTAGEWNGIAGRNQRVQIAIVPTEESSASVP